MILTLFYFCLIIWYLIYWDKSSSTELSNTFQPETALSVIIPARNEAENISNCLDSILANNYPKALLEIIVVDDHSTDSTAAKVRQFEWKGVTLVDLAATDYGKESNSFKKAALNAGIRQATGDLIVTTDADCITPPNWLAYIAWAYEKKGWQLVAGPVSFHHEKNLFERFQSLDILGMMLITAAGIKSEKMHMGNGANLAYSRALFQSVGGFDEINHLASGDDVLLIQKIAALEKVKLGFLKTDQAMVLTWPKPSIKGFWTQRIRWATKSSKYQQFQVTLVLAGVYLFCCSLLISAIFAILFGGKFWLLIIGQLVAKFVADFWMLSKASSFFNRKDLMSSFLPAQLFHVLYIVSVGTWANVQKKYSWKGRTVQ